MDIDKKLKELGFFLPPLPPLGGIYYQLREFGANMFYVSGCGPNIAGKQTFAGKIGDTYTLEQGQHTAQMATLNALAVMQEHLGDLARVKKIIKLLCFVASTNDFYDQPKVANGASQLLIDVFGEKIGKGARSAIGVNVLPDNIPFEIELVGELY